VARLENLRRLATALPTLGKMVILTSFDEFRCRGQRFFGAGFLQLQQVRSLRGRKDAGAIIVLEQGVSGGFDDK